MSHTFLTVFGLAAFFLFEKTDNLDNTIDRQMVFSIQEYDDQFTLENNLYQSPSPTISGNPNGNITYTLDGVDASLFTIDSSTGVVSMVARDFENPEDADSDNFYNAEIVGTDAAGNTASQDLDVAIFNDCSDNDGESRVKMSAPTAIAEVNTNAVLQVEVLGRGGLPEQGVEVVFTRTSGTATQLATSTTDANGLAQASVTDSSTGQSTYTAMYDSTGDNNPNEMVDLGSPTTVEFVDDISQVGAMGNVGIGTNNPDGSSVLEVAGTDRGVLIPRVSLSSNTDTVTIASPATSLLVYNLNSSATNLPIGFVYWNGAQWQSVCDR